MSDFAEFILARIAEDEQDARSWRAPDAAPDEARAMLTAMGERMLAECEAKRRIMTAFEEERTRRDIYNRGYDEGLLTTNDDLRARLASNAHCRGLEEAMLALALPYADHPDYRDEWKP